MSDAIVIVSAARTPIGGLLGDLSSLTGWERDAVAIRAALERAGVPGDAVDEVLFGNSLMAGQGRAPARQAARKAGLADSAGAVTLSKMCGSGMRAAMFGHDMLAARSASVVVAGGMESIALQIPACIQRQVQAHRALCVAPVPPVLPYSGCRPGRKRT